MSGNWSVKLDTKRLDEIIRRTPERADQIVAKAAFDGQADIQQSFTQSVSSAGEPPGVVTGYLKNSVITQYVRKMVRRLLVGAKYGDDLEFGTIHMAARPFFRPALARLVKRLGGYFKELI